MAVSYYARDPASYYAQRQQDQRQQFMNLLNLYLQKRQWAQQQKQQEWKKQMAEKEHELAKKRGEAYIGTQKALQEKYRAPDIPELPGKVKEYAFWIGQGMDEENARKLVYGLKNESIVYPESTLKMIESTFKIPRDRFQSLPPSVQQSYVSEGFRRTRPDTTVKADRDITPSARVNARKAIAGTTRKDLRSVISANPKLANPDVGLFQSRKSQDEGIQTIKYTTGIDIRLPEKYHVYKAYREQGIANPEEKEYVQNVEFLLEFLDAYPDIKTLKEVPVEQKKIVAKWGLMPVLKKLLEYR